MEDSSPENASGTMEPRSLLTVFSDWLLPTTDAVAIRLAIASGAERCIIGTNVDSVYDSDPRDNPNTNGHDSLTHEELQEIVGPAEHT